MLRERINSFKYAFAGIADLFKTQPNAWIHLSFAVLAICLGFFFSISSTEWCLLTFAISIVISAEAFNTALEHITDLVSPDYHKLAGRTKDVAAAGVLIVAMGTAIIGLLIFLPKILDYFQL